MPAPSATLDAIKTKVRRLTRSPSLAQLSNNDIVEYINTFVVYDFPEHIRTFNLRTTFSFYTQPGQDIYTTNKVGVGEVTTNPLYDFQNRYISVHPPLYVAGYQRFFSQSESEFYGIYPKVQSIASSGQSGDGVTTQFTGVINTAQSSTQGINQINYGLLQNNVMFTSIDALGNGIAMIDVPVIDSTTGYNLLVGNLYAINNVPTIPPTAVLATNTVNYDTGTYIVTFPQPPASGTPINTQTVPLVQAIPQAVMYYNNMFVVRPIPDQVYRITVEAYKVPYYLNEDVVGQNVPELNEYWQYIAYGAAKKILEDRNDIETVQAIMPEFKKQETLCLRRTLVQHSNERTATIYTEQTGPGSGLGGWGSWGAGPY